MSYRNKKNNQALEDASELLFVVESEWPKLGQRSFNPLETVLPLLDNTSVGLAHRYDNFVQLNEKISEALSGCIDSNKQQFIDHLSYYSGLSKNFKESFELVDEISKDLSNTNDSIISDNKTYLKDLNHNSMIYGKLLDTIELIEFVKTSSEQLSALISDKSFIKAQELIKKCGQLAAQYHLWRLPLLLSIKNQLESHENHLFEMLVEEIHSIIYLKLNVNKSFRHQVDSNAFLLDITSRCALIHKPFDEFLTRLRDQDTARDDESPLNLQQLILEDDFNFNYLKNLLIILQKLNKFDKLLEILISRQLNEMNQLFNKAVEDIKLRNPSSSIGGSSYWQDNSNELIYLEFGPTLQESSKLQDFFNTICTETLMVLQYHRIIYEVACLLGGKEYSIERVVEYVESFLLSIVNRYITDEEIVVYKNKDLKNPNVGHSKTKKAKLFEFKMVENDELTRLTTQLQEFFPTFNVDDDKIYLESNDINSSNNLDTIVTPSVFNMRVILGPLLMFVEGCKKILVEEKTKDALNSLELSFIEFMRQEYLKNFNQTLQYYYDSICTPNDSFDMLIHNEGIFKSCEVFQKFLFSILEMLNTSLTFKEEYVNSIFNLLVSLSNRIQSYYQEISDEDDFKWLNDENLRKVSLKLVQSVRTSEDAQKNVIELLSQEVQIILKNLNIGNELDNYEVFFEKCSQLLSSVQWLLTWLPDLLRNEFVNVEDSSELVKKWELIDINYNHNFSKKKIYLTLDDKNSKRYQKMVEGLENLEDNLNLILRYNIIYQSIYSILKFFNTNEFHLLNEINEPDVNILKLTSFFVISNKILKKNLNIEKSNSLVNQLSILLDELFIRGSFNIKRINENGLKKIFLNILIIQQLLRNLFNFEIKFLKSLKYFDLFKTNNDKAIIDQIVKKKNTFSFEENKNMIRLIYSSEDSKNMRRYNESIQRLSELYR